MGRRQEQGEAAAPRSSGAETPSRHSGSALPWADARLLSRDTDGHAVFPRRWPCPPCPTAGHIPPLLLDIGQEEQAAEDVQPGDLTARSGSQPCFDQP